MQSNKLLCCCSYSAIYQVAFRQLFPDVFGRFHTPTHEAGLTYPFRGSQASQDSPPFWVFKQATAHPHFRTHKQPGAPPKDEAPPKPGLPPSARAPLKFWDLL